MKTQEQMRRPSFILWRQFIKARGNQLKILLLGLFAFAVMPESRSQDSVTVEVPDTISTDSASNDSLNPFLTISELADSLVPDSSGERSAANRPFVMSDTAAVFLLKRVEELAFTLSHIAQQLKTPIDTTHLELSTIDRELKMIEKYYSSANQKIVDFRTLNAIEAILDKMKERLKDFEEQLSGYNQRLLTYQNAIEKIRRDSLNKVLPRDSTLRASYVETIGDLTNRYQYAEERLDDHLLELGMLQSRLTRLSIRSNDLIAVTDQESERFRDNLLLASHPPLWRLDQGFYSLDAGPVIRSSLRIAGNSVAYFLHYNWGIRIINISLVLAFFIFARTMVSKIRKNHPEDANALLMPVNYFVQFPVVSPIVAGLTFVPLVYGSPPLLYTEIIWLLLFGLMSPLLAKRFYKSHLQLWLILLAIYLLNGAVMLMITTTVAERWFMFALNFFGIVVGIGLLTKGKISKTPAARYYLSRSVFWVFFSLNFLAFAANFLGYYNIVLTLSYAACFQVLYVMALWVFIELMGELAYLYIEANKDTLQSYSSWLDYQELQQRLKRILGFVAVVLWFWAFLKSLSLFDVFYERAYDFFTTPRSLGSAAFTYGSLLVFIGVIYLSVLVSRLLAYIFGNHGTITSGEQQSNIGSTMLLVRIGVLGGGFLLALSAAGISLDKVAIVMGALGVGIGFGLQNIVGNLVSGIILAFEKPIKIGDVIELGPFIGKVKEIGIRSSKVITFDGADVIIPNGDLLSQQLTNWTLSNHSRRIELIVGVGYGSDIPTVREVMQNAIKTHEKVLHYPLPLILVNEFSDSSVNFRILFWTNRFDEWISIKSEVLGAIYDELNRAGIEIPFPKRDIFIHLPDKKNDEKQVLEMEQPEVPAEKVPKNGEKKETVNKGKNGEGKDTD